MPPKLGILAGGDMPALLISARRATGRECLVPAIDGQAESALVEGGATVPG